MKRVPARPTVLSVTAALAGVLAFCPGADAQITVPASTLPAVGDTFRLAQDNSPAGCVIPYFSTFGTNQTWDLSCLGADATHDVVYHPVGQGLGDSVTVPGATMFAVVPRHAIRIPGASPTTEDYYSFGADGRLQLLASYGRHFNHVSDSVFNYLSPLPERAGTLVYPSQVPWGYSGNLVVPASALPPGTLTVAVDSVRYNMTVSNRGARVVGWGKLTIPGGTYDVLSEYRSGQITPTIDVLRPGIGWVNGGQAGLPNYWYQFPTDTIHHTSYYNNVSKEPIAVLDWSNSGGPPVRVTFKRVLNDGDPCGDPSSSACNLPDTWSSSAGACVPNYAPAGSGCGDNAATACSNPDICNGAGACVVNDKANGTSCSDGNACTAGDTCQNGTCATGAPVICNDNNSCTTDSCDSTTGCFHQPDPVCAPQIALLTAVPQVESCAPANGVLDPSERVTYAVTLKNNSSQPTTNLVATLLASASVSAPSAAQSYGAIPAGGSATRSFTWTGIGACGAGWSAALALADGTRSVPGVNISGSYGTPAGVCNTGCAVVRITTTAVLTRNADRTVRATVTVTNTGSVQANTVMLTSARLGTASGTPLPQALNSIPPGQSTTATVTFPASVIAGAGKLKLGGTYAGGTFSSTLRVTVP